MPQPTNTRRSTITPLAKPVPDSLVSNSNVFMTRIDHNYGDKDHFYFSGGASLRDYNTRDRTPRDHFDESPTRPPRIRDRAFNWEHTFSSR